MTFEIFIEWAKFFWIPALAFAYKNYISAQEKQDIEISRLKEKVSQQMTKQDVVEVVNNAVEKLTLKIDKDLLKIDNGVHQIKNQFASKDSVLIELVNAVSKLHDYLDGKK